MIEENWRLFGALRTSGDTMSKKVAAEFRCPDERIRELEQMFLGGPVLVSGKAFTVEGLLDVLVVLYDECCNSSLRKEKTMTNFIEYGKRSRDLPVPTSHSPCLQRPSRSEDETGRDKCFSCDTLTAILPPLLFEGNVRSRQGLR